MIRTKKELEKIESKKLSKFGVRSGSSRGRKHKDDGSPDIYGRLDFQKDRDRILHSKAFRRLDEKTQVFPAAFGDHYRTRLTHTLEVAQISRDICRRLGLNEDLAEAIALAHDLGHPPFGHAGEDALDEIMKEFGGHFEHNEQSKRVVEKLEKLYPNFDGLNLTYEVLEGLEKHKTSWDRPPPRLAGDRPKFQRDGQGKTVSRMHFEGQVVNIADEIAYTNHDMDDGLRSGILKLKDLDELALFKEASQYIYKKYGEIKNKSVVISRTISRIITMMIYDICKNFNGKKISFTPEMAREVSELRKILFKKFYLNKNVKERLEKGKKMIKKLFKYYLRHPEKINEKYKIGESIEAAVKDYIAGMTDQFLMREIKKIK